MFAIKRHFPSSFSLCVPPRNVDVQTELTFSSQFAASHYGIRRTLPATGVPTVYDVRMATNVITDEKVSASQPGLSHDDIRANDSVSHVTSTTSRGSRSSLAKTRAKKAALLAQQKRQAERVALEQQKLQAEVQLEEAEVQKAQAEVQLKQQRVRTRAQCKLLELQSQNLQLQTDIEQQ